MLSFTTSQLLSPKTMNGWPLATEDWSASTNDRLTMASPRRFTSITTTPDLGRGMGNLAMRMSDSTNAHHFQGWREGERGSLIPKLFIKNLNAVRKASRMTLFLHYWVRAVAGAPQQLALTLPEDGETEH